ncbi:cpar-1, partial [Symbiodinium natans]
ESAAASARWHIRRGLDKTWQDEREQDFERRAAPDGGRGETVAAELRSYAELGELPGPPLPTPGLSDGRTASLPPSSLRRLKHVEAAVACGIERECGVDVSRGVDVFRLVLPNPQSGVRTTTRVLLVQTGEAFLCEEPISEDASETGVPHSYPAAEGRDDPQDGGSWLAVALIYFRAVPKRSPLSSKVGRVPALHVSITLDDGTEQAMEFIGVHQRRYYVEDPASDALAQHLTESLLRVALEFIFHPSRSRFAKERVLLRECSLDKEARHSREELLPRMVDSIRQYNDKIKEVKLEMGAPRPPANAARKEKSFLALDEDVLKVAPAKEQVQSAPPAGSAFRGMKTGFLNSDKAKKRGLASATAEAGVGAAAASSSAASSSTEGLRPQTTTLDGSARPPVETTAEEKRQLLLPAAEPAPNEARAREVALALRAAPDAAAEEEPDSPEDGGGPASLTELANQLFGVARVMPLSQENLAMLAAQNDPRIMHVGAVSEQRLATGNVPGLGSMNSWNMVPGLSTPAYSPTERAPSMFSPTFNAQNIDRRQLQMNQVDARQLALSQVDIHVNADTGPAVAMAAEAEANETPLEELLQQGCDEELCALKNGTRASADACVRAMIWRSEKLQEKPTLTW